MTKSDKKEYKERLERAAIAAFQGFISINGLAFNQEWTAKYSVSYAKALLSKIDEECDE